MSTVMHGPPQAGNSRDRRPQALIAAERAHAKASDALNELRSQETALENKQRQIGLSIGQDGKLTAERRRELTSVKKQLRQLQPKLRRAQSAYGKARERFDRESAKHNERLNAARDREAAQERAKQERKKAANQKKVDRRAAQAEKKLLRGITFARLPEGAKPSKGVATDEAGVGHGYIDRRGKQWVLVVTDGYTMNVLPLEAVGGALKAGTFIPPQALKEIEKAGAFRVKNGGIQPLHVDRGYATTLYEPGDRENWSDKTQAHASVPRWTVREVGTGYLVPATDRGLKFPAWAEKVVKRPAKKDRFEVAIDPRLLQQVAETLGSKQGVVLSFDLSKAGKASDGRACDSAILVLPYDSPGTGGPGKPREGKQLAIQMPKKLAR
jgi:hypothetical protein